MSDISVQQIDINQQKHVFYNIETLENYMSLDLWTERFRPSTLDGYVFKNSEMRDQINEWVENPQNKKIPFPNLLLSGVQGTGKTTLAKIMCNIFNVNKGDILEVNASRENNVDAVRDKIVGFCSTWPIGDYKVVILDEFDGFSHMAQKILRGEMEKYADSVRFILTANYPNKIIPALHSRLQGFHFDALDRDEYLSRLLEILVTENIEFSIDDIQEFVSTAYPDLRKGINLLEQHVRGGKLHPLNEASGTADYLLDMVSLFSSGKIKEARQLICSQARPEEYDSIYRFLYENLELFGSSDEAQSKAIIEISKGIYQHSIVADPEICLAATMCRLSEIIKS